MTGNTELVKPSYNKASARQGAINLELLSGLIGDLELGSQMLLW